MTEVIQAESYYSGDNNLNIAIEDDPNDPDLKPLWSSSDEEGDGCNAVENQVVMDPNASDIIDDERNLKGTPAKEEKDVNKAEKIKDNVGDHVTHNTLETLSRDNFGNEDGIKHQQRRQYTEERNFESESLSATDDFHLRISNSDSGSINNIPTAVVIADATTKAPSTKLSKAAAITEITSTVPRDNTGRPKHSDRSQQKQLIALVGSIEQYPSYDNKQWAYSEEWMDIHDTCIYREAQGANWFSMPRLPYLVGWNEGYDFNLMDDNIFGLRSDVQRDADEDYFSFAKRRAIAYRDQMFTEHLYHQFYRLEGKRIRVDDFEESDPGKSFIGAIGVDLILMFAATMTKRLVNTQRANFQHMDTWDIIYRTIKNDSYRNIDELHTHPMIRNEQKIPEMISVMRDAMDDNAVDRFVGQYLPIHAQAKYNVQAGKYQKERLWPDREISRLMQNVRNNDKSDANIEPTKDNRRPQLESYRTSGRSLAVIRSSSSSSSSPLIGRTTCSQVDSSDRKKRPPYEPPPLSAFSVTSCYDKRPLFSTSYSASGERGYGEYGRTHKETGCDTDRFRRYTKNKGKQPYYTWCSEQQHQQQQEQQQQQHQKQQQQQQQKEKRQRISEDSQCSSAFSKICQQSSSRTSSSIRYKSNFKSKSDESSSKQKKSSTQSSYPMSSTTTDTRTASSSKSSVQSNFMFKQRRTYCTSSTTNKSSISSRHSKSYQQKNM